MFFCFVFCCVVCFFLLVCLFVLFFVVFCLVCLCFRHAGGVVFLCFVLWCGIFISVARCNGLVRLGDYDG